MLPSCFGFLETSLNCKLRFYSRAPGFCFSFEYLIGYIMVKKNLIQQVHLELIFKILFLCSDFIRFNFFHY